MDGDEEGRRGSVSNGIEKRREESRGEEGGREGMRMSKGDKQERCAEIVGGDRIEDV